MIAFLLVLGAQLSTATDLTQDAMIEMYQRWDAIEHPKTYVRTMVSRSWARLVGSPDFRNVVDLDTVTERADLAEDSPLAAVVFTEISDRYRRDIAALPPRQRQVIAWSADEYEPHEIAKILGLSAATIRSNLRKARAALKSMDGGHD